MARTRLPSCRRALQIGRRVYLRRPTRRDQDEYLTLRRRSADFLKRWEPAAPRGKRAAKLFAEWLRSSRGGRHEKLLICRREDGAILGAVNLNEIVRGPAQSAFLGYWIGAAHALKGSVANFRANAAVDAASQLELMGRHGDLSLADSALANLEKEIERVREDLEAFELVSLS